MKEKLFSIWSRRIPGVFAILLIPLFATSCSTTYDTYGNPRQSVDPGVAVAGAVAAGLIGYALADDGDSKRHHRGHGYGHQRNYYGGGYGRSYSSYGGGYYRGGRGNVCY